MKIGEVKEQGEAGAGGSEEIVGQNVELFGDGESWGAEEVDDEGDDGGGTGNGSEGLVDIRIITGYELKGYGFERRVRGGVLREGSGGEVAEVDGGDGGGYGGDVRAGVERGGYGEDGDGE